MLSSHILSEVEALCDRVTIIRAGRAVETGTLEELRHLTRTSVTAVLSGNPGEFQAGPGVHDLVVNGNKISFSVESDAMNGLLEGPDRLRSRVAEGRTADPGRTVPAALRGRVAMDRRKAAAWPAPSRSCGTSFAATVSA